MLLCRAICLLRHHKKGVVALWPSMLTRPHRLCGWQVLFAIVSLGTGVSCAVSVSFLERSRHNTLAIVRVVMAKLTIVAVVENLHV